MDILLRQKNQNYKKDFMCFIYGLFIKRLDKQVNIFYLRFTEVLISNVGAD